jgi:hypothetical protein
VATATRKGVTAIVPGHPEQSEMWRRVTSDDPDERMPPPQSNRRPLSESERALVRRWIEEGAPYEPHWSFVPPRRPEAPEVQQASWCRNDIDRFVLARLEHEGVTPGPEADRETLARRVYLDVTGLPPTPDELDAFVADIAPDALERLLQRLFTEEPYRSRYAERMATPWLDAARYADTCGIHMDAGRSIWLWRDWLLDAYRKNMSFDRFVTEQMAGDLLPDATEAQKIASGFNRNHVTTDEGGAIAEEYLVEYAVDRASTTGSVLLGLTLGCARCHEHKFDPISQDEFYRFYAFFNSIDEPGLYSQLPDPKRAFEPFMEVPTAEQAASKAKLDDELERERAVLDQPESGEAERRAAFFASLVADTGLVWQPARVTAARSKQGATLTVQADGSVLASGSNPSQDEHAITLRTDATDLRLVMLEALVDPSLPMGRMGRAPNGNAVLSGIQAEAISVADPSRRTTIDFTWAWADYEQQEGDHAVVNALDPDALGWAVGAHQKEGGRVALFLAREPFGFAGGTDLVVRLQYQSVYAQHSLGRVRLQVAQLSDAGLADLPSAHSVWYLAGPFPGQSDQLFATAFGPETEAKIDLARNFGDATQSWRYNAAFADGRLNNDLPAGTNVSYVGRTMRVPTARKVQVSLGSDDGFKLFVDGREVGAHQIDRSLAADQDKVELALEPGTHAVVLKIVNTGGDGGFFWREARGEHELGGDLVAALLPEAARSAELTARLERAWRLTFSPTYRARTERIASLEAELAKLDQAIPRTMVMHELPAPRETYVLTRGQYDHPDKTRPVTRGVPAFLGAMPEGAPPNRLGLAQWLTAASNPLVTRVAVNRLWEMLFGSGLVRTSEDFGLQGEWPSHPELLDWLAVEFREGGFDVQHMLTLMITCATYRQSSRQRPELAERDPENRWLAYFPRRRLSAEQIRDQALYIAGLLVEQLGGPSVKPYQPDGLWQEVAMLQSNTRIYERGMGNDLWRRSLYTYWKRACPPPSLLTFDAPTRECCTIRRPSTNTPLQALVLWNDEQFVEAARALAQRALASEGDEAERLARLFRRCTGRTPETSEVAELTAALDGFRRRYREAPEDAEKLVHVGEAPAIDGLAPDELAAWTLIASAVLNLDATISRG